MGSGRTNLGGGYVKVSYNITSITGLPLTRINPTSLSVARSFLAGASVGNYALFAGGYTGFVDAYNTSLAESAVVDAYDRSLVRTTPTALSVARSRLAGATVGNYALFAGGGIVASTSTVDAYDTSLVRTTPTVLGVERSRLAGASVGNYALFAGGVGAAYSSTVDAYDTSLVRTTPTVLGVERSDLAGASVGNYALFAGGYNAFVGSSNFVDAYNTSLVRSSPPLLPLPRYGIAGASVGSYAVFAGGRESSLITTNIIYAYDTSLTRTTATLNVARGDLILGGSSVANYAVIGGGTQTANQASPVAESINASLISVVETGFTTPRYVHASASIGGYVLFAGGSNSTPLSSVEAYAPAIKINLPAGSKHLFSPATSETTVVSQTTLTLSSPVSGYVKFKKGTVTAV